MNLKGGGNIPTVPRYIGLDHIQLKILIGYILGSDL